MHVSQILISDADGQELSPFLKHATGTIAQAYPGATHTIYNNKTLREFIVNHYDPEVVRAYDTLRPYAYKADLGRYCLLHVLGGWYFDIAIRCVNAIKLDDRVGFLGFREIQRLTRSTWACSTGIIYSKPGNRVLQTAIEKVVQNCRDEHYGITPLCPTGPTLFGEALAANRGQADFMFGDHMELTPTHPQKNRAFVLPDGTIMAWGKPAEGGDLTGVGAKGVNNYNKLWAARQVYAQGASVSQRPDSGAENPAMLMRPEEV